MIRRNEVEEIDRARLAVSIVGQTHDAGCDLCKSEVRAGVRSCVISQALVMAWSELDRAHQAARLKATTGSMRGTWVCPDCRIPFFEVEPGSSCPWCRSTGLQEIETYLSRANKADRDRVQNQIAERKAREGRR